MRAWRVAAGCRGAGPVTWVPSGADHGEVVPRKAWFVTLGVLGIGSLTYVFVVRGFVSPDPDPGGGLGWPLVGVLPLYALGMWLLTATSSRVALYVAQRIVTDAPATLFPKESCARTVTAGLIT